MGFIYILWNLTFVLFDTHVWYRKAADTFYKVYIYYKTCQKG